MRWAELNRDLPPPCQGLGLRPPSISLALPSAHAWHGSTSHRNRHSRFPNLQCFTPVSNCPRRWLFLYPSPTCMHAGQRMGHTRNDIWASDSRQILLVRHFIVPAANYWRWLSMLSPIRWVVMVCWWWGRLGDWGSAGQGELLARGAEIRMGCGSFTHSSITALGSRLAQSITLHRHSIVMRPLCRRPIACTPIASGFC
jgi:hypothetical protein